MTDLERYDDLKRQLEELRERWCGHANLLEESLKTNVGSYMFNSDGLLVDEINASQIKMIRTLQGQLYDVLNPQQTI